MAVGVEQYADPAELEGLSFSSIGMLHYQVHFVLSTCIKNGAAGERRYYKTCVSLILNF